MELSRISRRLSKQLSTLSFAPPVTHVYDPLVYARGPHEAYLERWGKPPKPVLWLGMNPGPFGMAQTGVPFGEIASVREWLGIQAPVGRPKREHPKRPIEGFACKRAEVSGARLWGFARDTWGTPQRFFERIFVYNYCPLVFMESSGKNRTPDKLPEKERAPLFAACDDALRGVVKQLKVELVVGVGAFAEKRAREALTDFDVRVGLMLHPSPASPKANRGWAEAAARELAALGVHVPRPRRG